jgi:hypothetical protein
VALETVWPARPFRWRDTARASFRRARGAGPHGAAADIVILTNIGDQYRANWIEQLGAFDIRHRVPCNQGGKGRPVLELIEEMRPTVTAFVDDLAVHHESVNKHAPFVWRLQMVAEPRRRPHPAGALRSSTHRPLGRGRFVDSARFAEGREADPAGPASRARRGCLRPGHDRQHLRPHRRPRHRPSRTRRPRRRLCPGGRDRRPPLHFRSFPSIGRGRPAVGETATSTTGSARPRPAGVMLIAQMKKALGSLDRVERVVKLGVFVNSG